MDGRADVAVSGEEASTGWLATSVFAATGSLGMSDVDEESLCVGEDTVMFRVPLDWG